VRVEATFTEAVTFREQAELRAAFNSDRLFVEPCAEITLIGRITLGLDVVFAKNCFLSGPIEIETGCHLTDVVLGAGSRVRPYSLLGRVRSGLGGVFGPYCFLRDGVSIGDDCILGAHVEVARARFGARVKISHRAFVGDADFGDDVIVGAGTTFCNFDGVGRQTTRVGSRVILGSGTLLVAPVIIEDGAVIAAGSTITRDVPAGARIIQKRSES